MQTMPQADAGSNQGPSYYVTRETPRLLETPSGYILVGYGDRELARVVGVQNQRFCIPDGRVGSGGEIAGAVYTIERIVWGQATGILLLQGAPLQSLIGPNYAVVAGTPCHPASSTLHTKDVVLARVESAPSSLRLEEAVWALRKWLK